MAAKIQTSAGPDQMVIGLRDGHAPCGGQPQRARAGVQPARHVAVQYAADAHQGVAAAPRPDMPRAAAAHRRGHLGEFVLSLNAYAEGTRRTAACHAPFKELTLQGCA